MNGSAPLHASMAYSAANAVDPFDFDLFTALARESPPSLASADQVMLLPSSPLPATLAPTPSIACSTLCTTSRGCRFAALCGSQSAPDTGCHDPQSAAVPTQDSSPSASAQPAGSGEQGSWGVPCTTFHNYAAQLDGLANDLWEPTPPVAQSGVRWQMVTRRRCLDSTDNLP